MLPSTDQDGVVVGQVEIFLYKTYVMMCLGMKLKLELCKIYPCMSADRDEIPRDFQQVTTHNFSLLVNLFYFIFIIFIIFFLYAGLFEV